MARRAAVLLIGAAVVAFPAAGTKASLVDPALSVTGEVTLFSAAVQANNTASVSGAMNVMSGGVASQSTIAGTTVTGDDPLIGALTATGDGVGANGSLAGFAADDYGELLIDLFIDVENTSATDSFKITFKVVFASSADANGLDALAVSIFEVFDPSGAEVFFTDITSDTLFGDDLNGTDPGTFGALISDSGMATFDVTLAPMTLSTVVGLFTLYGEAFDLDSAYTADLDVFLSIDAVTNVTSVPEPATIALFGFGLAGLGVLSRRRRG